MLYGFIDRDDKEFYLDLGNVEAIQNQMVVIEKGPGFMDYNQVVNLYNTSFYMMSENDFNEDIINLFKEIVIGLNVIRSLRVDNSYIGFDKNLDEYTSKHNDALIEWEVYDDTSIYDRYLYKVFSVSEVSKDKFKEISNEDFDDSLLETPIHISYDGEDIDGYVRDDIHKEIKGNLFYIPEVKTGDVNKDICLSFSEILNQVSNFEAQYSHKDNVILLGMTQAGFNFDHHVAINHLLRTFNYLLNSNSLKDNELYFFDKVEVENRIELAKIIISRIPNIIKSRIK